MPNGRSHPSPGIRRLREGRPSLGSGLSTDWRSRILSARARATPCIKTDRARATTSSAAVKNRTLMTPSGPRRRECRPAELHRRKAGDRRVQMPLGTVWLAPVQRASRIPDVLVRRHLGEPALHPGRHPAHRGRDRAPGHASPIRSASPDTSVTCGGGPCGGGAGSPMLRRASARVAAGSPGGPNSSSADGRLASSGPQLTPHNGAARLRPDR